MSNNFGHRIVDDAPCSPLRMLRCSIAARVAHLRNANATASHFAIRSGAL